MKRTEKGIIGFTIFFILLLNCICLMNQYNRMNSQEDTQISGNNTLQIKTSVGQEWLRIWEGDNEGNDVAIDKYNNCYLVGGTSNDVFLIKYDSAGNLEWIKTWGGPGIESGNGVVLDSNSEYIYVVGGTTSFGAGGSDGFLVKYDLDGNQLWNRTWGRSQDDIGFRIAVDNLGNCYIAGIIDYNSSYYYSGNAFLIKFNAEGTPLWNQTLGGPSYDEAADVAIDSGNNCYLACVFGFGTGFDLTYFIFIAKYTPEGTQLWNRTYGPGTCEGLVIDNLNNFYILAYWDGVVYKFDSNGNQLWSRIWNDRCVATDIAIDNDNNCYITGSGDIDDYFKTHYCAFIVKLNSDGIEQGHSFFYDEGMYWGEGIAVDNYNNYYIAGKNTFLYTPGAFLFKGNSLNPSQISGFEGLFLLIIGQIVGLIIIELYYRKKN